MCRLDLAILLLPCLSPALAAESAHPPLRLLVAQMLYQAGITHRMRDAGQVLRALSAAEVDFLVPHPRSGTYQRPNDTLLLSGVEDSRPGYESSQTSVEETLLLAEQSDAFTFVDMATYLNERDSLEGSISPCSATTPRCACAMCCSVSSAWHSSPSRRCSGVFDD